MNRLFKLFLLVLFISPLFSYAANAAVKIVFAYAPDWNNPTEVVEIERYYDDSTNNWYYDLNDRSKYTFGYVEVPLEGTFSDAIPFIFEVKSNQYVHSTTNLVEGNRKSNVSSGIVCERTLTNANTLICKMAAYPIKSGYYSASYWAKNKSTSGGFVLDSVLLSNSSGGSVYNIYEVVYSSKTSKLTQPAFQTFYGQRTNINGVVFDTNNPGVVCEYPNCNTFVGSFSVVNPSPSLGLTDAGYNQTTSCAAGDIIKNSTTIRRPAVYCDYNSATDTNPICRIDYAQVSFSATPFFCSVGGTQLESPSPSEPILIQNPITTNTTVVTIPTCFNTTVKLSDNIERYISYAPSTQKYYNSSNCRSDTEFKNNKILLELDASQTKIPVAFSNTSSESVSETTLSSLVTSINTFYCGYDSKNSSTQLVCNFTNPPTQDDLTFYPSAYATLDNRALTIGGTETQRLIAYCNPLSFSGKTFYSKYDDAYALHWYSDNKCTSELTGDFPLQFNLSDTAAAVPIVFFPGTSGGSSSTLVDKTITNNGPIYCEYDSAVSGTALKCKYNSSGTTPGGQLAAPNTTESYYPRMVAGFVDDKHLSVTNDIANATTTVTYTTNICNTINIRYQNSNSPSDLESKTLYWNGGTWCKQSGCTDCGYSDKDVLTNSAGYYPAYFSQTSTNKLYQVIGSVANIEKTITETTGVRFPCSYENETLTCNYIKDSSYTWYVYVFVAPRVTGAITGGNLQNFKTNINGTSIYISGKYYPMMCSDHIKVHFYGINSLGNYGELTTRNNYVKYFYETGDWVNANGATSDTFAGLGILSNLTNSTTVNGTTYGNGLSAYRAAYIGGAPTSTTPPDNIIITKTTGIVTPEDRPYDLMVTGDSLPKLPQSLFSNDNGSVKDMYYNLLYAANCLDPDGLESHSTCELEIHPNGRALYKNQCLLGWKDGNFGDDSLTNATVPSQMLNVTDSCEM